MYRCIASLLVFATFLVAPLDSSAAPITVPTDLNPGDKYRLAFVTSTTRDATDTLIGPYNDFVTAVAAGVPELAALGTTWRAIGSTATVAARDNTGTNPTAAGVPIYRLDDTRIASDNADLWDGTIESPLTILESGAPAPGSFVNTGTINDGTPNSSYPLGGASLVTIGGGGGGWIDVGGALGSVQNTRPFYGMSGVLTVVPEPSSFALVAFGFAAFAAWGWRRRKRAA